MTSLRQIEANRRNALKSTGPRTEVGKEQSRRNAYRHGLTAETAITCLEDLEDYKAFEATLIADYDPETAVERELVLRLASLLWRSRRAILIESGLFAIQANIVRDRRRRNAQAAAPSLKDPLERFINAASQASGGNGSDDHAQSAAEQPHTDWLEASSENPVDWAQLLTHSFLRLANLESGAFALLNRYEVACGAKPRRRSLRCGRCGADGEPEVKWLGRSYAAGVASSTLVKRSELIGSRTRTAAACLQLWNTKQWNCWFNSAAPRTF